MSLVHFIYASALSLRNKAIFVMSFSRPVERLRCIYIIILIGFQKSCLNFEACFSF